MTQFIPESGGCKIMDLNESNVIESRLFKISE